MPHGIQIGGDLNAYLGERTLDTSILVALNDSMSSREVLEFLQNFSFCRDKTHITLAHIFRKPSSSEEMMGKKFMDEQPAKFRRVLESARDTLVENGFPPKNIDIHMTSDTFPTVADGIIDLFEKGNYSIVVIGRKKMSKAEEFVLGDPSVKLVRVIEGAAVLVVKSR